MSRRVRLLRGHHNGPHRHQPLHIIASGQYRHLLLGLEGWKPRRGGWYVAFLIRKPRVIDKAIAAIAVPIVMLAHRRNRVRM